jgi:hypothetical protein
MIAMATQAEEPGRQHSPESRAKMSAARKGRPGRPLSPEHRAKISKAKMGRPLSPEHRAKVSEAQKGRTLSPEHRAKISKANKGKKRSPETRSKMAAARRGRALSPESRAKISAALTGRPGHTLSPESRAKISAAKKGVPRSPETVAKMSAGRKGGRYVPRELVDQVEAILDQHAAGRPPAVARPEPATSSGHALPAIWIGAAGDPVYIDGLQLKPLTRSQYTLIAAMLDAGQEGMSSKQLSDLKLGGWRESLSTLKGSHPVWERILVFPGRPYGRYRLAATKGRKRAPTEVHRS